MHSWTNWEKPAKNEIEKNLGNLLVIFIPAAVWQIFNTMKHKQWLEMKIESTEIYLKKLVKSQNDVNLICGGF